MNKVWIKKAADLFDLYVGQYGAHTVASGGEVYIQPYVDLSLHLIQMQLEGWNDVDYDYLAVVSGASALYGYQPNEFMPKYAHLQLAPDQRIAEATGFSYEWLNFKDINEAWEILKQIIGAGHTAKGWDWENILFAGYEDAQTIPDRKVFALADGPGTYAKWLTWEEFSEWANRIMNWQAAQYGVFAGRVEIYAQKDIALRVLKDLAAWSEQVPVDIQQRYKDATFGLRGIKALAREVGDTINFPDYVACHGINPQWALRRSTAIYLDHLIESDLFSDKVNEQLRAAAQQYYGAFAAWKAFYTLVGHHASDGVRNMPARRKAGAQLVQCWAEHEKSAVSAIKRALDLL